jgi:hypothetical protein
MTSAGSTMLAFLRRAHRRRVAWRGVEGAGIGGLIGAAVAAATVALLALRGATGNVMSACVVLMSLGALAGMLASLYRLPSLLDTAIDVDRQLGTPDLLSSALAMLDRSAFSDAAFADTILACAELRVRDVTLARLVAQRLGPRAWGGIGLAVAGVFTVAMMVASPNLSSAAASGKAAAQTSREARRDSNLTLPSSGKSSAQPDARQSEQPTPASGAQDELSEDSRIASLDRAASDASAHSHGSADATGSGRSGDDTRGERRDPAMASSPASPPAPGAPRASSAGGNGVATTDAMPGTPSRGVVRSNSVLPPPPWRSSSWDNDRARALEAIQRGAVPDRYRQIVRDYFNR